MSDSSHGAVNGTYSGSENFGEEIRGEPGALPKDPDTSTYNQS